MILTLFLPSKLSDIIVDGKSLLLGYFQNVDAICYVTVTSLLPITGTRNKTLLQAVSRKSRIVASLATNYDNGLQEEIKTHVRSGPFISLKYVNNNLEIDSASFNGNDVDCQIVYFNPKDIVSSEILPEIGNGQHFSCLQFIHDSFKKDGFSHKTLVRFSDLYPIPQEFGNNYTESQEPHSLLSKSTCALQLFFRLKQIKFAWSHYRTQKQLTLHLGNFLLSFLLDIIIGIAFTSILLHHTSPETLIYSAVTIAESIIDRLEDLLHLLMETPAGLKLNLPLNRTLGQFFIYHMYLLRTYVSLLRPLLASVSQSLIILGFFGVTFILALLSDLFSLATIHIYCFYGYAARLYSFFAKSLRSLWRLFRGKKWNHLRQRVDSFSYQHDQLFVGCTAFTILLFLLPTVFVYYSVFLLLRLSTLTCLFVIESTLTFISTFPAYALILRLCRSPQLTCGVSFEGANLRTTVVGFGQLFYTNPKHLKHPLDVSAVEWSVGNLVNNMIWGNIICPL